MSLLPELAPDRYRHSWPEPCLCPVSMAEVGGTDRAMPRTCVHGAPEPFDTVPKSAPPAIIVQSIVVVACPCGCTVCDCRSNNGTSNGCSGPDAECRCLCPSRAEAGYRRGRRMGPVSARSQDGLGAASCCVIDRCGSHTARIDCLGTCCCSIWSSGCRIWAPGNLSNLSKVRSCQGKMAPGWSRRLNNWGNFTGIKGITGTDRGVVLRCIELLWTVECQGETHGPAAL